MVFVQKTAKFFAERFNKSTGKIVSKTINASEVIDHLTDRGEDEVIVLPKRFNKIDESLKHDESMRFFSVEEPMNLFIRESEITVVTRPMIQFTIHKNGSYSSTSNHSEVKMFTMMMNAIKTVTGVIVESIEEDMKILTENPIFIKWKEKCEKKYRGLLAGKEYNI